MGSGEYAMQLQFLLGDIRDPKVPNSAINFTRCVYYQCYPKILQRMRLPVAQGGLPFKDLFAPGSIDNAELLSRFQRTTDEAMDGKIATGINGSMLCGNWLTTGILISKDTI